MAKPINLDDLRAANPRMARLVERALKKATAAGGPSREAGKEILPSRSPAVVAPSKIVQRFEQQLRMHNIPEPEREFYAIPGRDFRWDYAWPECRVLVEIQGQQHRIKGRFKADIEKRALALISGWRCLELDRHSITTEKGVEWLRRMMGY